MGAPDERRAKPQGGAMAPAIWRASRRRRADGQLSARCPHGTKRDGACFIVPLHARWHVRCFATTRRAMMCGKTCGRTAVEAAASHSRSVHPLQCCGCGETAPVRGYQFMRRPAITGVKGAQGARRGTCFANCQA